jgi:hypothetical protein
MSLCCKRLHGVPGAELQNATVCSGQCQVLCYLLNCWTLDVTVYDMLLSDGAPSFLLKSVA